MFMTTNEYCIFKQSALNPREFIHISNIVNKVLKFYGNGRIGIYNT